MLKNLVLLLTSLVLVSSIGFASHLSDPAIIPNDLSYSPFNPRVGEPVTITARIVNLGSEDSNFPIIKFYENQDFANPIEVIPQTSLAPGEERSVTITRTFNQAGGYEIWAEITNITFETNTGNNWGTANIVVSDTTSTCSGNLRLSLIPNIVRKGQEVNGIVSG